MLKNDRWITEQAQKGMLEPFQTGLVRHLDPEQRMRPVLSFGCSSYGYDLRLSSQEFAIFRHVPGTVMNPKRFNPANLSLPLHEDEDGGYFILPAHSYGLGVALEKLRASEHHGDLSRQGTYARLGIIVNTTPAEASWEGHLTLEFSNSSGADCRIYANEGICQPLFSRAIPRYHLQRSPGEISASARACHPGACLGRKTRPVQSALLIPLGELRAQSTRCGHIKSQRWRISS